MPAFHQSLRRCRIGTIHPSRNCRCMKLLSSPTRRSNGPGKRAAPPRWTTGQFTHNFDRCTPGEAVVEYLRGLNASAIALSRFEDHSSPGLSIHQHGDRLVEMQQAHAPLVLGAGLRGCPVTIDEAFARIRINSEVADAKSGEVLKEMAALGRRIAKVFKPGFHNDSGARN